MSYDLTDLIRRQMIAARRHLSTAFKAQASANICQQIMLLTVIQQARTIATYSTMGGEPDLKALITDLPDKIWLIPNDHMDFIPFLSPDAAKQIVKPQDIDVILLPLVAFDAAGHRIGRGKGHYDRALYFMNARDRSLLLKPYLIGIAYAFQEIPVIIPQPWDVRLDLILTEGNT